MSVLRNVLRGIVSAVDQQLDAAVSGNGGNRKVRRLQNERARYKDELNKTAGKRPRRPN